MVNCSTKSQFMLGPVKFWGCSKRPLCMPAAIYVHSHLFLAVFLQKAAPQLERGGVAAVAAAAEQPC